MSDHSTEMNRLLWSLISSVAGAITSLSFQSWKNMTKAEVAMSLFVAASFAFFVGPLVLDNIKDARAAGGVIYLMATGSNVLIPWAVKQVGKLFGNGASETENQS